MSSQANFEGLYFTGKGALIINAIMGAVILLGPPVYLAYVLMWSDPTSWRPKDVGAVTVVGLVWGCWLIAPWLKARSTLAACQRALRITPGDCEAYKRLGNAYATLGRYHEAVAAYKEAGRLAPGDLETIYSLGIAYLGLEDEISAWAERAKLEFMFALDSGINSYAKTLAERLSDRIAQYRKSVTKN